MTPPLDTTCGSSGSDDLPSLPKAPLILRVLGKQPRASDHVAQFDEQDAFLMDVVGDFLGKGLGAGDACIVIATPAHRAELEARLQARGYDLVTAQTQGTYLTLDAAEMLARLTVDVLPDPARFAQVVGGLIERAAAGHRQVRLFGEMVALLWQAGKQTAAFRLEDLWNQLQHASTPFSLLCATATYDITRIGSSACCSMPGQQHPHVLPDERASRLADLDERQGGIIQWQQKTALLEAEIADRTQAEARLREQIRLTELQLEVSAALTASGALRDLLSPCARALVEHLGAAFARVWTLNEAEEVLELQASSGLYTHLDGGHARVPLGAFKIGRIAQARLPHLTNDVLHDPQISDPNWAKREGMVAFAGYPLLIGERLLGVMALFARAPLSEATFHALATVANTIALGIERAHMQEERVRLLVQEQAARAEAEKGRQHLRFMAESMPQKIFTAQPTGDLDYLNLQWMEFTGLSFEQMRGWGWTQFIHPDDVEEHVRRWQQALETGEPFYGEQRFRRTDGVYRWHVTRAIPMRDAHGDMTMWIGSTTEIEEQKALEARKDEFLKLASHELRTPLTVIQGHLQLVQRRLTPLLASAGLPRESTQQVLSSLSRALHQMEVQNRLIGDLLDVSRIQTGKLELELAPCDLVSLVREVVLDHQTSNPTRPMTLSLPEREESLLVLGDADRLEQVVGNYVTNALKYSAAPAPVNIGLGVEGSTARVWVRDQGPGLSKEQQQRIWERFYQAQGITVQSGARHGLGLGLYICQTLIARHGGVVGVESTPERGATFWFTLPLFDDAAGEAAAPRGRRLSRSSVAETS